MSHGAQRFRAVGDRNQHLLPQAQTPDEHQADDRRPHELRPVGGIDDGERREIARSHLARPAEGPQQLGGHRRVGVSASGFGLALQFLVQQRPQLEGDVVALPARQLQRDLGHVDLDHLVRSHRPSPFSSRSIASFKPCHDSVRRLNSFRPSPFSE